MMEDAIEILELQERIPKKGSGRRYFTGDLNGCRVVMIRNDNVLPDEGVEAIWSVFIQPGQRSRWQRTEKGAANAAARRSKARQENINALRDYSDEADR